MVHQHFFGRLEIIPQLLSLSDCHAGKKIIKTVVPRYFPKYAKNAFAAEAPTQTQLGKLTALPRH